MPTNEYFDNATQTALPKGQTARAESVDAKFNAITTGLDKLPTVAENNTGGRNNAGTSGGSGNAYTATLSHVTALADGQQCVFTANHASTGAVTLDLSGTGDVAVVMSDDSALASGAIPADATVEVRYNSTLSKWVLISTNNASVSAAAASATAAAASASAAASSASSASSSASAAASSASSASSSASNASTSETNAAASALTASSSVRHVLVRNWSETDIDPTATVPWYGVCWSAELSIFVAVAANSTNNVSYSIDGAEWTQLSSGVTNNFTAVVWSPDDSLFVAVARSGTGNRVMTSPDGATWTARSSAEDNQWFDIAYSSSLGLYVAVAIDGTNRVMTSTNGTAWTARSAASARAWRSVCWAESLGMFIACAETTSITDAIMTSTDGITWTSRTTPSGTYNWKGIAWSESLGIAVAAAGGGHFLTSTDGITWTLRTPSVLQASYDVEWSPELGMFVAVNQNASQDYLMISEDGINWSKRLIPAGDAQYHRIAWSPELMRFCAVAWASTSSDRALVSL